MASDGCRPFSIVSQEPDCLVNSPHSTCASSVRLLAKSISALSAKRPQIRVTGSISKVPTPRSPESLSNMRSRLSARLLRSSEALSKDALAATSRAEARPSMSELMGRFLKTIKTLTLGPKRFRQTAQTAMDGESSMRAFAYVSWSDFNSSQYGERSTKNKYKQS